MLNEKLIKFYQSLRPPGKLPGNINILYPQKDPEVMRVVKLFFKKFYHDDHPRRIMLGINPGRFGAGITGINFTAPRQLKENCRITHPFGLSSELSAEFIYEVIEIYGGVKKFFKEWYIGAVCPFGFVKEGKNLNYYDDKNLVEAVTPFIVKHIRKLIDIGFKKDLCLCIGGAENFKFLNKLNEQFGWFDKIEPLPHPRFILQYRRKKKESFIHQYLSVLRLKN